MLRTLRLTAAYLIGVLVFSSADVACQLSSHFISKIGQATDSYEVVGLRAGAVTVGSYYGRYTHGPATSIHLPQFFPLPFFVDAGREGGVVEIAAWLVGLVAWTIHLLLRLRARRFPDSLLNTSEK